ncbi:MAG: hypothetical protein IH859_03195 [Chloroflexi bacterium]|nr:hypothetical protein [Chloroflexota bacterium]
MRKSILMALSTIILASFSSACSSPPPQSATATPIPPTDPPPAATSTTAPTPTATVIPKLYPDARGFAQMIFHPPSGQVILYGGESNQRSSFEETWSFDANTNVWTELLPDSPPINVDGPAAYDSESDVIIFFFSSRLSNTAPNGLIRLGQTWSYKVSTNTWTNLEPEPSPFGLMGARMVYDSESDRIILFGGADFTTFPGPPYFDETWTYDYNANTWEQMQPVQSPLRRTSFGFAYDSAADRALAFGGNVHTDDQERIGEMWEYDYNTDSWSQIEYTGAVLDDHHPNMAYDPNSNRTYYYVNREFWSFDYDTRAWTQLDQIPESRRRFFLSMALDNGTGKLVLFGGGPAGLTYDNRTWVYDINTEIWSQVEPPAD